MSLITVFKRYRKSVWQEVMSLKKSILINVIIEVNDFIFQILGLTRKLEHQYLGVSSVDHALIQQTRLKAGTLQILTKMKSDPTRCSQAKETYLQQLQALKKSVDPLQLNRILHKMKIDTIKFFLYLR